MLDKETCVFMILVFDTSQVKITICLAHQEDGHESPLAHAAEVLLAQESPFLRLVQQGCFMGNTTCLFQQFQHLAMGNTTIEKQPLKVTKV